MGRVLSAWDEVPDLVLTSSAMRARTTAEEAARAGAWECPVLVAPDFYGTGPDSVLQATQERVGEEGRIMLVGHEPTWSMLAERISGGRLEMRTGAVVAIDLLVDHWHGLDQARGWVRFAINPRMFFGSEWDQDAKDEGE
jgi:phosphohistidine phosphatase